VERRTGEEPQKTARKKEEGVVYRWIIKSERGASCRQHERRVEEKFMKEERPKKRGKVDV